MNFYKAYFSPTGRTKQAADALLAQWPGPWQNLDLSAPDGAYSQISFCEDDLLLAAVPSFGGRVPAVARERLAGLKANRTRAILLCAYGNRAYEDTLLELKETLEAGGFQVAAAVSAVTEHSIFRQYGAGRPDAADRAELRQFSAQIQAVLSMDLSLCPVEIAGNHPFRSYNGVPLKPKAGRACTQCGACAKLCPVGAIPAEHPNETDSDRCISCMRCVTVCPAQARSLNGLLLMAAAQKLKKACAERKKNELFLPGAAK